MMTTDKKVLVLILGVLGLWLASSGLLVDVVGNFNTKPKTQAPAQAPEQTAGYS